jgi:hypothetical protein
MEVRIVWLDQTFRGANIRPFMHLNKKPVLKRKRSNAGTYYGLASAIWERLIPLVPQLMGEGNFGAACAMAESARGKVLEVSVTPPKIFHSLQSSF